jgi:hypothetical protein
MVMVREIWSKGLKEFREPNLQIVVCQYREQSQAV